MSIDDVINGARAYLGRDAWLAHMPGVALSACGAAAFLVWGGFHWLVVAGIGLIAVVSVSVAHVRWLFVHANQQAMVGTEAELELTASGLLVRSGGDASLTEWAAITDWRDGDRAILLLNAHAIVVNIPKRAFTSSTDFDAARAFITTRIDRRHRERNYRTRLLLSAGALASIMFVASMTVAIVSELWL